MTREQKLAAIANVNWIEVHKAFCFPTYGYRTQIIIHSDGSISEMQSNNSYADPHAYDDVVGILRAQDIANLDSTDYIEGWTKPDGEGNYITNDGETLSFNAAVKKCIETGDWDTTYEEWKNALIEQE